MEMSLNLDLEKEEEVTWWGKRWYGALDRQKMAWSTWYAGKGGTEYMVHRERWHGIEEFSSEHQESVTRKL